MRAVVWADGACRFLDGVLEGVGSIVTGSIDSREWEGPPWSESESAPTAILRALTGVLRGVLCTACLMGEIGEDGGDESCVGARAKRVCFTVGGGVESRGAPGDRSLLNELYGLLCAELLLDRRGEYGS